LFSNCTFAYRIRRLDSQVLELTMMKTARALVTLLSAAACTAALAQYKVVGPDGKVTYTDTPPPLNSGAKITRLGENPGVVSQASLPYELRQVAQKYPVTLYTLKTCDPCDAGRAYLRGRGVPFIEKLVITGEDGEAMQRITGGRDAPTVSIGAQVLRGFSADNWGNYLDVAGYPRESKLPPNYQFPSATPLTEPAPPPEKKTAQPAQQQQQPVQPVQQQTPGNIKF
jgi:glutaredoxin